MANEGFERKPFWNQNFDAIVSQKLNVRASLWFLLLNVVRDGKKMNLSFVLL